MPNMSGLRLLVSRRSIDLNWVHIQGCAGDSYIITKREALKIKSVNYME